MKFYLAGPIGFTKGLEHKTWRDKITKFLEAQGHEALNPLKKSLPRGIEEPRDYLKKLRSEKRIQDTRGFVRRWLIPSDLAMVDRSDIILAWVPKGVTLCGTYGEVTYGYARGKAIFVVTPLLGPLLPNWLIGCSTFIFRNFKEFRRFMGESKV